MLNLPEVIEIANTKMDEVIQKEKKSQKLGKKDFSTLYNSADFKSKKKIYLYESDKQIEERRRERQVRQVVEG